jgi:hypothetical protein
MLIRSADDLIDNLRAYEHNKRGDVLWAFIRVVSVAGAITGLSVALAVFTATTSRNDGKAGRWIALSFTIVSAVFSGVEGKKQVSCAASRSF